MSKISLTRIDLSEENEVTLSPGEVCIGRGSILGCDDKRISRNHGLLQISEDGSITLVAMHSNPCFYKVKNLDSYAVLMKGQNKVLSNGDEFALLPNSFQYRVVVKTDEDIVPPLDNPESLGVNGDMTETASKPAPTDQEQHSIRSENTTFDAMSATPSKRKRMLPGWLTGLSENECTSSTTITNSSPSSSTATSRKRKASTAEVKTEIKEEPLDLGVDTIVSDVQEQTAATSVTTNQHDLSDEDDDVKPKVGTDKDGYEAEYGQTSSTTTGSPNRDTGQNAASSSSRESCVYGSTCYRKNPQHRIDFSHPGDADFQVSPNLPECPYGTSCYRKNLQHRKDFKHTQPPTQALRSPPQANGNSPTTKTRRKRMPAANEDDSEDDYDYNDPFLNDASSDDYQPTSSEDSDLDEDDEDDEESQERKRMLREAKKFTKKKKA